MSDSDTGRGFESNPHFVLHIQHLTNENVSFSRN